jgi:hypothetical protein
MIKLVVIFSLFSALSVNSAFAVTGDTTHVTVLDKYLWTYYGTIDNWAKFPAQGKHYEKILLRYKLTCPSPSCGQWDYTTKVFLRHHTGVIDSVLQDAPNFTVNGSTVDSFLFRHDTTKTYSYNSTKKTTDSAANSVTKIYFYKNPASPFIPTDSIFVWQAGYWNYRYNTTGAKTDSFYVKPDSILHVTKVKAQFHFEVVVPYEIGRLITPYGQAFPTNWNFTWTMDVTDYAFMLHDSCEFTSEYDGYSQGSLYSLSFDMIEGIPPRETYRIDVINDGYFPWGNDSDPITNYVKPIKLWLDSNAGAITFRSFLTAHGNGNNQGIAEFTPNTPEIWVNGAKQYEQPLWRECGFNAVAWQSGTWTFPREGWCPGDKVDPWDFDLTGMGKPNDSILVDHRLGKYTESVSGAGYALHNQIIYSKGPQFGNDVALVTIQAPTNDAQYRRTNPICSKMSPLIKVRNNGKNNLKSLVIKYGIDGATDHSYSWIGDLKYYDTVEIDLPGIDLSTGSHTFNLLLDSPNGSPDEYPNNNIGFTSYTMPKIYSNNVYLSLLTEFLDGEPNGISYELDDVNDNILYSQSDMPDATVIRDTFKLATGCYRFKIFDASSSHQGLYPWLLKQGIPDPKITYGNYTLKDDKKATIWNANSSNGYAGFSPMDVVPFMVQAPSSVSENSNIPESLSDFSIYPNPAHSKITLDLSKLGEFGGDLRVSVISLLGKELIVRTIQSGQKHLDMDMHYYPSGNYIVRLQYGDMKVSKRCVLE